MPELPCQVELMLFMPPQVREEKKPLKNIYHVIYVYGSE